MKYPDIILYKEHHEVKAFIDFWPEERLGKIIGHKKSDKEVITDKGTYVFLADYRQLMSMVIANIHFTGLFLTSPDFRIAMSWALDRQQRGDMYNRLKHGD